MEVRTQDGACCHRVICTQPAAQLDAVATKLHCGQGARVCVEVRVRVHVRVHVRVLVRVSSGSAPRPPCARAIRVAAPSPA